MDKTIVVRVSDLLAKAQELSDAKMQYVSLMTLDADEFDGEITPPSVVFTAIQSEEDFMAVDFEEIEIIEDIKI